mmetsp:Transcript_38312/g.88586  ORF Transcript_38312/g.88586 Transcript_38312/m.88586 type:complete len:310 (+) Transcript_38312:48-977(+)
MSCLTRTIQVIWLGVGVIAAMREFRGAFFDHQVSYIVEERRLQGEPEIVFQELRMQWPYGSFFHIEALECNLCEASTRRVMSPVRVRTPFACYDIRETSLHETMATRELFCGSGFGCLAGLRVPDGLVFGRQRLQLANSAGRISGGLLGCDVLEKGSSGICLLLAVENRPGRRNSLRTLLVQLPPGSWAGAGGVSLPGRGSLAVIRAVDLPANLTSSLGSHQTVFHLEGTRLWLLGPGWLELWTVLPEQQRLRRWSVGPWREFQPTALCRQQACNDGSFNLLVAGRFDDGPGLFQLPHDAGTTYGLHSI